jgi:5'(3')-deoxyribonucleotidase
VARTKKRLLVDCDEVLSDFHSPACDIAQELFKVDLRKVEVWDIFTLLLPDQLKQVLDLVAAKGYCASLKVIPGAQEGIEILREDFEVVACTKPFHSPTWVHERTEWLMEHFGFTERTIIYTAAKFMVSGDALVDDNPHNAVSYTHLTLPTM